MASPSIDALTALGLNALEAEVYVFLLGQAEPVTAYRAGKALGKATANVYKAMEALALKGAVTIEDAEPRLCRAAPAEELLGLLERRFRDCKRQAADALADLRPPPGEERIYRLETVPLILERAGSLLRKARKVAVLDAFPEMLEAVLPQARAAAERGVEVRVLAYGPVTAGELDVTLVPRREEVLEFWKSQQLNLVVDGQEALLALVCDDLQRVHQAFWTDSLYLSCLLHAGLGMEQTFHRMESLRKTADFPPELEELMDRQRFFFNSDLPGQQRLFHRMGRLYGGRGR